MSEGGLVPFARVALEVSQEVELYLFTVIVFLRSVSLSRNCWRFCA